MADPAVSTPTTIFAPRGTPSVLNRGAEITARQSRLLIVDADCALRDAFSGLLREVGYRVMSAGDGVEALRMIGGTLPDLVITDLHMPGRSGFELLATLRERFPQIPVIAVSEEFTGDTLPAGVIADAFLPKDGYTSARFAATIKELLAISPMRAADRQGRGPVSHDVTYDDADMRAVLGRLAHEATPRSPEDLGRTAADEGGRSAWRPSAFATSAE